MKNTEQKILKHLQERGWDNLRPGDLAKSISIEASELLENFQWDNPTQEELKKNKVKLESVKSELADVLIYCFEFSILFGFDTEKIILKKLTQVNKKYPAKLMRNRKGEAGTEDVYWKIKNEYRKNSK